MTHGSKTCLEHSCRLQSHIHIHGREKREKITFFSLAKRTTRSDKAEKKMRHMISWDDVDVWILVNRGGELVK